MDLEHEDAVMIRDGFRAGLAATFGVLITADRELEVTPVKLDELLDRAADMYLVGIYEQRLSTEHAAETVMPWLAKRVLELQKP